MPPPPPTPAPAMDALAWLDDDDAAAGSDTT